ncbi:neuropilin and tolloid-like protein 1 [Saccoglossus kowalevskii]|uniref:Neuropilin and tolloid-like protein 1-like n=1 Tax=Saccoglossus kowalevskii TaxID=10224 RepID=A0ABM0MJT6_SACKO|nr:PREDICTED: neuropilin and tolloid-like protein 1-like [Saccoglossus kowalevskii]
MPVSMYLGDDQATDRFPKGYDILPECGGLWKGPEAGYIHSPNHPGKYENSLDCVYVIEAVFGHVISLTFDSNYMIESSVDCSFDVLEIRDGRWGFSPLIGTYCGNILPELTVTSGRYLWMRFSTDDTVIETGFNAFYDFIPDCVVEIGGIEGEINSVEVHPNAKSNDIDCIWQITAPLNHKLLISFKEFTLDKMNICDENQVSLYDRLSHQSCLLHKFCSGSAPDVFSYSNRVYIRYVTGTLSLESSFIATYTAFIDYPCNGTYFACGQEMCIDSSLVCNNRPNCYHYAWDEKNCPEVSYTPPLMDIYAGVLFSSLAGTTMVIIGIIIALSCRHSWRQTKRRASIIDYRRRSLAHRSSARSSDATSGGGLHPGEFNGCSISRRGSLSGDQIGISEYHELDTISSKYNHSRRNSVSSGRSSPTHKMANSHSYQSQPVTLQVPPNTGQCAHDKKDGQYPDDRIVSTSFTYGQGFENFSTDFSRPRGSFDQEFTSMLPFSSEPRCMARTVTEI